MRPVNFIVASMLLAERESGTFLLRESFCARISYRGKYRGVITRDISHFAIPAVRPTTPAGEDEREKRRIREKRDRNLQKISTD